MRGPLKDDDIERAARSMIRDYRSGAATKAAEEACNADLRESRLLARYWRAIEKAVREIQAEGKRP